MSPKPSFRGVTTELLTPFQADGSIAFDLLGGEVERQVAVGVAGLFTNGLASESLSLDAAERVATTACVVEAARGRLPVMANVVANSLPEAERVLRGYEGLGVDAVCLQAPYVYALPQPALLAHLDHLAKSTELPCGFYNAPQTGNTATPETVSQLFAGNPNLHYYKESTIDFLHIQTTLRLIGSPEVEFLNGTDATTVSVLKLGGQGVVSLISAVFPEAVLALTTAAQAGDWEAAQAAQDRVLRIRQALKTGPFDAGYKFAAGLVGCPLGAMRPPLAELSPAEAATIERDLRALGLVG
ncbi:MAG: dihydrodipicolinate synthase family protein [Propionibacteriaceae bacterium]|jgi:4-hydroxy-tetrahydrodipicolinate synthase|nr:dihydrodipicolinate synthase family protein [Propionibacteriaceae bacterium]